MASKSSTTLNFLLIVNLLLFSITSACNTGCPTPKPKPKPVPCPSTVKCPLDTLKLGVCADVLHDLINIKIGKPPKVPCCPLIGGLVDLEAALCLCTAIKGNVLGIVVDVNLSISLLLNFCGKKVPAGFQCP